MLASLRPLLARNDGWTSDIQLLELYGEIEAELEAGAYVSYRQVLSRTVEEMGRRLGVGISADDGRRFAESLTRWEPFSDTVASLRRLAKRFRLGIISNVDDDMFAVTKKKLPVAFDVIVTAQQVQSYKPSRKNFQAAFRRSGLRKPAILHAGQSLYHDIAPANSLGIKSIWVNRPSIRPGAGAAKHAVARPTVEVKSLAELVEIVLS